MRHVKCNKCEILFSNMIQGNYILGFGYDPDTPGSKSILWKTEEELKEPKSITVFD